ncbi:Protein Cep89 homolog [Eumeta japonica]|uniref:Protein Cep89 homolog n=1 Tax=Eumeta variegata TaxID=151549 RepID=A0A4C1SF35_EUMVA|nr:Protein Cep89 homolog [Eumeta japonica]
MVAIGAKNEQGCPSGHMPTKADSQTRKLELAKENWLNSLQECKELLEQLRQHSKEKTSLELTIAELNERNSIANEKVDKLKHDNSKLKLDLENNTTQLNELRARNVSLERGVEKVKRSRDRLKARLRIALQWAQKLEEGQANLQSTWMPLGVWKPLSNTKRLKCAVYMPGIWKKSIN